MSAWYLFLGFPIFVIGLCLLIFPKNFLRAFAELVSDIVNLRMISVWYYTMGAIIGYVGFQNYAEHTGKILLLIGIFMVGHSGVLQLAPNQYSKFLLKLLPKFPIWFYRAKGSAAVMIGIVMCLYAIY